MFAFIPFHTYWAIYGEKDCDKIEMIYLKRQEIGKNLRAKYLTFNLTLLKRI